MNVWVPGGCGVDYGVSFPGFRPRGGGGTLIFSAYVGSDPASTVHPKKYLEFQVPQKNI